MKKIIITAAIAAGSFVFPACEQHSFEEETVEIDGKPAPGAGGEKKVIPGTQELFKEGHGPHEEGDKKKDH